MNSSSSSSSSSCNSHDELDSVIETLCSSTNIKKRFWGECIKSRTTTHRSHFTSVILKRSIQLNILLTHIQFIEDNLVCSFEDLMSLSGQSIASIMDSSKSSKLRRIDIVLLWEKLESVYKKNTKGFYLQAYSLNETLPDNFSRDKALLKGAANAGLYNPSTQKWNKDGFIISGSSACITFAQRQYKYMDFSESSTKVITKGLRPLYNKGVVILSKMVCFVKVSERGLDNEDRDGIEALLDCALHNNFVSGSVGSANSTTQSLFGNQTYSLQNNYLFFTYFYYCSTNATQKNRFTSSHKITLHNNLFTISF